MYERIIALILCALQGCQALGGLAWGMVADSVGLTWTLGGAALSMALAAIGSLRHGLYPSDGIAPYLAPVCEPAADAGIGPTQSLRMSRQRLDARGWELLVDPLLPGHIPRSLSSRIVGGLPRRRSVRLSVPELRLRERVR